MKPSLIGIAAIGQWNRKIIGGSDNADEYRDEGEDHEEARQPEDVKIKAFLGVDADHIEVL